MTEREQRWLFSTPRYDFDTRDGILARLRNNPEKGLFEVAALRQLYCELHKEDKLLEYVVDGEYLLERHGELHKITDTVPKKEVCVKHRVLIVDDFLEITQIGSYHTSGIIFDPEDYAN